MNHVLVAHVVLRLESTTFDNFEFWLIYWTAVSSVITLCSIVNCSNIYISYRSDQCPDKWCHFTSNISWSCLIMTTFGYIWQSLYHGATGIVFNRAINDWLPTFVYFLSFLGIRPPIHVSTRIPETTSVIKEIRWSDSAAVYWRSAALTEDTSA